MFCYFQFYSKNHDYWANERKLPGHQMMYENKLMNFEEEEHFIEKLSPSYSYSIGKRKMLSYFVCCFVWKIVQNLPIGKMAHIF